MDHIRLLALSASRREAATLYLELKRGLDSLATVAASGSLLGLFLAVSEFLDAFSGPNGSKTTIFGRLFLNLTEVWLPVAYGVGLSTFAHAAHRILIEQVRDLVAEAELAAVEYVAGFSPEKFANSPRHHP